MLRARSRWLALGLAAATVATIVLAALVPLLFRERYYFLGDSQVAYFGTWYHFGELLRAGTWPLVDPSAWRGGNYVVDGQMGLFSPLSMVISLSASATTDALLFMTALKVVFLSAGGLGTFLLARSYRAPAPAAYVAGVAAPLGGQTMYFDAPSWALGLICWALLPWVWWALRRSMWRSANPFPALFLGLLVVTVGYVFGTLVLAVVVAACLVDALVARSGKALLVAVGVGVVTGLVALTVYLPGILSAEVTIRSGWEIANTDFLGADVAGLAGSVLPTGLSQVRGWWGEFSVVPLLYVAWFLPLLTFVDWRAARNTARDLVGLGLVWMVSLAWVLAPTTMGPLRYPIRMMPYVVLTSVVAAVVLFARARVARLSRARLYVALAVVAASVYLSSSQVPRLWRAQVVAGVLVALGLVVVFLLLRNRAGSGVRRRNLMAALFVGAVTVLLVGVQHHYFPKPTPHEWGMPAAVEEYKTQLPHAKGDTLVIGKTDRFLNRSKRRGGQDDVLFANSWYLNPHPVQNVYTPVSFAKYSRRYCIDFQGATCPRALETVLSSERFTGAARADLLAVSTLKILRAGQPPARLSSPPAGWRIADESRAFVTWVRDQPLPGAGGVAWSSPGVEVREVRRDMRGVTLEVQDVPPEGGRIVLSRLAWPGYTADGARLGRPTDDYLLTVELDPAQADSTIAVRYTPPGWRLEMATLAAGLGLAAVWCVVALVMALRRPRRAGDHPAVPTKDAGDRRDMI